MVDGKRYHRTIEGAWARLRDRPGVLSPREFEVVEGWRRRGIPTGVVLEVMRAQARRASALRSLSYLGPAVEKAWSAVTTGRAGEAPAPGPASGADPRTAWRKALAQPSGHDPLDALLAELVRASEGGIPAPAIDARLDAELPAAAPRALLDEVDRTAAAALAPFRGRMLREEFDRTLARARVDRLRAALGLPRLA